MPRVTCLRGITDPVVVEKATTVVIEDDFGTPIGVVYEHMPGAYLLVPANDPDFNRIMEGLGLDHVKVTVTPLRIDKSQWPTQGQLISGPFSDIQSR